jgi:apolipoprotein N-acyltransferase
MNPTAPQPTGKQFLLGLALSALSGLLLILSFPPFHLGWLMWIAFVPSYYATQRLARPGWQAGLITALPYLIWLELFFYGMWPDVAWFNLLPPAIALLLFGVNYRRKPVTGEGWYRYPLLMALQAVVLEWARSLTPIGIWGLYGNTQHAYPLLLQIASFTGVWGISFVLIFLNATIATLLANGIRHPASRRNLIAALVLVIGVTTFGAIRLSSAKGAATVRVAMIQHGQPDPNKLDYLNATNEPIRAAIEKHDYLAAANWYLDRLAPLNAQAAAGHPDVIIWPELMIGTDPTSHPELEQRIKEVAIQSKAYLVVPYASPDEGTNPHFNMLALYGPDGARIGAYEKQHITYTAYSTQKGEATYPNFPVAVQDPALQAKLRLATMICFDADFIDTSKNLAAGGAQMIAAPSDDMNWAIGARHFMHIPIQAVQNGVAIAKTDNAWVSVAADPWGRTLAKTADTTQTSQEVLQVVLPVQAEGGTFYTQHGDWFAYLCLGLYLLSMVGERRAAAKRSTAKRAA